MGLDLDFFVVGPHGGRKIALEGRPAINWALLGACQEYQAAHPPHAPARDAAAALQYGSPADRAAHPADFAAYRDQMTLYTVARDDWAAVRAAAEAEAGWSPDGFLEEGSVALHSDPDATHLVVYFW